MDIRACTIDDLERLVPAFDKYRQFYRQESQPEKIREFLKSLIEQEKSKIFLSYEDGELTGFVQLYPSYSSIGLAPIWILNDFFIFGGSERRETARGLLDAAKMLCEASKAIRLEVTTRKENHRLHSIYRDYGFEKDYKYDYYFLRLSKDVPASNMLK
ncbi:GNAT family N-acetyltransferase [Kangiella shandongensis]|uniref:GNAT family N-acetyltransferase n=1 Tax=Kangiella shandongensis TaxID=2763258 RepID=UPI001CBBF9F9|nr:GNAT family N-acetyltransferase [Kangiella shandongensis]